MARHKPDSAPSKLKARIYSALVRAQQADGPLRGLDATRTEGRKLCVFEHLVQILPAAGAVQSFNYCRVCHARVLAERFEDPPIYWPGCPYADFKKS